MAAKAKWKGGTFEELGPAFEYLSGVPARDLSDEDYAELDTDTKKAVRESPLYDVRSDTRTSHRSESADADSSSGGKS